MERPILNLRPEWKSLRRYSAGAKFFRHPQRGSEDVWEIRLEVEAKNDKNVQQKIV